MEKEKFCDVKVGDTALIEEGVFCGFGTYKYFWVPKTVTKVTPTQIVLETGDHYYKKNGKVVGYKHGKWSLNREGEKIVLPGSVERGPFNFEEVINDQTSEMKELQGRLRYHKNLRARLDVLQKIQYDHQHLERIGALLVEAEELFKDDGVVPF